MTGCVSHGHMLTQPGGGKPQKRVKKACAVCKQQDRRMDDKQKGFPLTENYCESCDGWVHGRGAGGARTAGQYDGCWDYHLVNCVRGLKHSGDMDN